MILCCLCVMDSLREAVAVDARGASMSAISIFYVKKLYTEFMNSYVF